MGVANKSKADNRSRREMVEQMRRQQRAAERRKTMLFVLVAVLVGLGLIAAVAVPAIIDARNDPAKQALTTFGVPSAQASCDAVVEDDATGTGDHVKEGTKVTYKTVPPSYGSHDGTFLTAPRAFYTTEDVPPVEKLVHSLEHGHTILWYDATVTGAQLDAIKDIAERARTEESALRKFIAAPLDPARGALPAGKHVALSHWGSPTNKAKPNKAYRQLCGQVSGEAVLSFINAHPWSDSPEPNAA